MKDRMHRYRKQKLLPLPAGRVLVPDLKKLRDIRSFLPQVISTFLVANFLILILLFRFLVAGSAGGHKNYPVHIRRIRIAMKEKTVICVLQTTLCFPVIFSFNIMRSSYNTALFHHLRRITPIIVSSVHV